MLTALSKLTISPSLFLTSPRLFRCQNLFFLEVVFPHFKFLNHPFEQLSIHILFLLQHSLMIFYLLLKNIKICLELRIFVLKVSRSPFDKFPNDVLRLDDHKNHLWLHFCCSFCSLNRKNIRYPLRILQKAKERSQLPGKFVYFSLRRCLVEGLNRCELGKSSDYLGGFLGIVRAHIYINIDLTLSMMQILLVFGCFNVPSHPQVSPNRGRSHQQSRIQFLIFLFNFFYSDGAGEGRVGFEISTERTRRQTIVGI